MRFSSFGLGLAVLLLAGSARAATPDLPSDPRLQAVRPRLEAVLDKAASEGLSLELRELIVGKVREGLAKNVDPARIESAAARLGESLVGARAFVKDRRPAAEPELVRAVAEARLAGVDPALTDALVRAPSPGAARAVEVLTDLNLRGYPVARAAGLVGEVLAREPAAVGRVPSTLETVRVEQALTHAETVDAVTRGMRGAGALAAAARKAAEEKPGKGAGAGNGRAGEGPGKGNSEGFVPPGQLKKQAGAQEAKGNAGKGNMGMGNSGMGKGAGKK